MKRCTECGCLMDNDHDGDVCEYCQDERGDTISDRLREETKDLTVYIYDIEVFSDDWVIVFRNPEYENNHIVIHNDNYHLKEFLEQPEIVIGGFNNKHYDDWIVLTMLNGGSNVEVKRHNDFVIGGGNGWEFPFIQFQKKPFQSFDLRDDIADKSISLKAIEGNMYLPIVESSVPFDIDRPLMPDELEEVIRYCKNDVDATVKLYQAREEYITSKKIVGAMYGVSEADALGLTNAKLSARILDAKFVTRDDERDYHVPECVSLDFIPEPVLSFFMQIRDLSIPATKLFGTGKQGSKGMTLKIWIETGGGRCPVTYSWGGVHGAKPAFIAEASGNRLIVNYDVSSLYPNSMINFGYCSRSMSDPDAYKKLVETRLKAKKAGDKVRAAALKLVVNSVYGAMLNQYNDLADRRAGRSVCITNQLAMTQLIVMLARRCSSIDFININTDSIMFYINHRENKIASAIVNDWCEITGFEMERDNFSKVYQKDVNNYIGIKTDGHMKTKGGYVSLYNGGDFKTNSLQIIHKAVVEYLVHGTPPEETINNETDVFKFQNIVKTGGTFEESYHYVNGELMPLQKVNRLYAVKNPIYGQVIKRKWVTEKRKKDKATGKMVVAPVDPHWEDTMVSECPKHTFVDNENTLTVEDLDREYYIAVARDRINKYVNLNPKVKREIEKFKEVVTIMAEKTTETVSLNIYGKILEARKRFLKVGIKKTGVNRYAEYKYFTLDDIIPIKQSIFKDLGLADVIAFTAYDATLRIFNVDNPTETLVFTSPLASDESLIKNPIQKVGAIQTYVRRYLYMLALDIIESDSIEAVTDKPVDEGSKPVTTTTKNNRPATEAERQKTKSDLIDKGGTATGTQTKAIKAGLKKLREKDAEKYEDYVKTTVGKMKAGLTKTKTEDLLIEIGKKIEE